MSRLSPGGWMQVLAGDLGYGVYPLSLLGFCLPVWDALGLLALVDQRCYFDLLKFALS